MVYSLWWAWSVDGWTVAACRWGELPVAVAHLFWFAAIDTEALIEDSSCAYPDGAADGVEATVWW